MRYMDTATGHDLLTADEVATIFRVARSSVYRWHRTGVIASVNVGGSVRFRRSDVEALLAPEETES